MGRNFPVVAAAFPKFAAMKMTYKVLLAVIMGWMLSSNASAQKPISCSVSGSLIDSTIAEPVVYATVKLLRNDSLLTGCITDDKGNFAIKDLRPGTYRLEINHLAYEAKVIAPLNLYAEKPNRALGKITLQPKASDGPAVQITDRQDLMLNTIDKKVYNVERNQLAAGGAVTDMLKNIPSVEVDIDGNLSLRGSGNVTVLIDGKPSSLTGAGRSAAIQQIPASSVKSIEVITNPSARFDPDGMAGIINIVTKKDKAAGLNGNLSVGLGTHQKYNASLGLNYRAKKFNVYTSYSFRLEDRWNRGWSTTLTPADTLTPFLAQRSRGSRESMDNMLRGGVDWYASERTTIGIAGGASMQDQNSAEISYFEEEDANGAAYARYDRPVYSDETRRTYDGELNLSQRFKQQGRTLDARIAYSEGTTLENSYFRTIHFLENGMGTSQPDDYQNNYQADKIGLGTAQVDYAHMAGKKNKLEGGLKATSRDIINDFASESLDHSIETYVNDSLISNTFHYQERIFAGYGIWTRSLSTRLGMQVGLRAEEALTQSILIGQRDPYPNNYFNLFPNAYLNYRPKEGHDLRLSYSRRINRPTTDQLNPFTDYSNPKRLRIGNPRLLPEYIDAVELSWGARYKWGSVSSTGYFRYMTDSHTRYWEAISPGSDTLVMTFANLLNGQSYGLEAIGEMKPAKWMECMVSLNLFRTVMNATNLEPDLTVDNLGMTAQFNSTYFISKNTSLQIGGNYRSPRYGPQGVFAAMFSADISVKQNLFKGKGSLNLRMSDLTNTQRFKITADTDLLVTENYRKRESRIGYVTFTYRFGKGEASPAKRRRTEERQSGDPDGGF